MAMGMPCVGSRAAGLEEIIIDGVNGLLSDSGDPKSLADAIETVLREPSRLDVMGAQARARVVSEFDTDKTIERLVALFGAADAGEERPRAAGGMR